MRVKKVAQIRFYQEPTKKIQTKQEQENKFSNYPSDLTAESLINGKAFSQYDPIVQLGIQALPGTTFYLNGHLDCPIIIGQTGIYELNLNGEIEINALSFKASSITAINNNEYSHLIVDIVYEGVE